MQTAFFAFVIIFSATGLIALALASVVTIASAAISEATRLPIIAFDVLSSHQTVFLFRSSWHCES